METKSVLKSVDELLVSCHAKYISD